MQFLEWDLAGPVIAAVVLVSGSFLLWRSWVKRGAARRGLKLAGSAMVVLFGVLLCVGAAAYQFGSAAERSAIPMPGTLVDVGGYRLHVYCEGEAPPGRPTLVWVPGGYGAGLYLRHLQQAWTERGGRSCIVDRAGTGWSDEGPSPRSIKQTVIELDRAMATIDEDGPFVLAGHSVGGMTVANWAKRASIDVAGIVVLDPTPQTMIAAGGMARNVGWCGAPSQTGRMLLSMFGIGHLFPQVHPMNSAAWKEGNAALMPVRRTLKAFESRPRNMAIAADAFNNVCNGGYEDIRNPGDLGDLPLFALVQEFTPSREAREEAAKWSGVDDDVEWELYVKNMRASALEYPRYSSRGTLEFVPKHFTHNFPIQEPDYTIDRVYKWVEGIGNQANDLSSGE